MEMYFSRTRFFAQKELLTLVNSNLQFCVSVCALNTRISTQDHSPARWVWIAWINTKNQTSCSTTIYQFELNFSKWNFGLHTIVHDVCIVGWIIASMRSFTRKRFCDFFPFVCRYNTELSGLWFQQIFQWIIQKLHIRHELGPHWPRLLLLPLLLLLLCQCTMSICI